MDRKDALDLLHAIEAQLAVVFFPNGRTERTRRTVRNAIEALDARADSFVPKRIERLLDRLLDG